MSARYSALQKGMSLESINIYYNPYIANMTIDDSLHPFLKMTVFFKFLQLKLQNDASFNRVQISQAIITQDKIVGPFNTYEGVVI